MGRRGVFLVKIAATLAAITALIAAIAAFIAVGAPGAAEEIEVDRSATGAFSLVSNEGKRVTEHDFRGRFLLVFFGYTSCPDVCPTDLATIGAAMKSLGKAQRQVQPIFITVDPERDTPEVMDAYAKFFHPGILGLTGTADEVAVAAQNFGAIYVKVAGAEGRYTLDHSAHIYLLGPDARFRAVFPHGIDAGQLAAGIRKHLKEAGQ